LKQGANDVCNNVKNCKMTTTSLRTLANIYEKEQLERAYDISLKPWYVRPQWKELQNNHKKKKEKKKE
jgi:hypothetical protein